LSDGRYVDTWLEWLQESARSGHYYVLKSRSKLLAEAGDDILKRRNILSKLNKYIEEGLL